MPRLTVSKLTMMLVLVLTAVVPEHASGPPSMQAGQAVPAPPVQAAPAPPVQAAPVPPVQIPLDLFQVPDGLEVTLWATIAAAAQPDQHRHRPRRPHLGGRRRSLSLAPCPPARRRSHRRAAGHRRRRQGRQRRTRSCRNRPDRAARRLRHRQQDRRRAAARPHRLHRRRSQPALRSGGGQARGAADRLPGHQSRPLAPLGHGRPGRQVGVQRRQHRGDVHRSIGKDVPHLRLLSSRSGGSVQVSRTTRRRMPASPATTGTCTSAGSPCA